MRLLTILFVLLFTGLSQAADLKFSTGYGLTSVLPVSLPACSDPNIANPAPSFSFNHLELEWNGEGRFVPEYITVTYDGWPSSGSSYQCTIAGAELAKIFPNGLDKGMKATNNCSVRCGNIPFATIICLAQIEGYMEIGGRVHGPQGPMPMSAKAKADLHYVTLSGTCDK